jgi:hypothetical protein
MVELLEGRDTKSYLSIDYISLLEMRGYQSGAVLNVKKINEDFERLLGLEVMKCFSLHKKSNEYFESTDWYHKKQLKFNPLKWLLAEYFIDHTPVVDRKVPVCKCRHPECKGKLDARWDNVFRLWFVRCQCGFEYRFRTYMQIVNIPKSWERYIRKLHKEGMGQYEMAAMFGFKTGYWFARKLNEFEIPHPWGLKTRKGHWKKLKHDHKKRISRCRSALLGLLSGYSGFLRDLSQKYNWIFGPLRKYDRAWYNKTTERFRNRSRIVSKS